MSESVTTQSRIYIGAYDVSGDSNKVNVDNPGNELPANVFTNTAERTVMGLYKPSFSAAGYVTLGSGQVHERLRSNLGIADVPVTVSPQTGAVGDVAVFMKCIQANYNVGAAVGEILPFTVDAKGRGIPAISGKVFVAASAKTANGNSIGIELGAVPAGKKVYAAIHILAADGTSPTLDITVESDTADTFGSAVTQLTATQVTDEGYQFLASDGSAITDTYWRVAYELGGTSPSFTFVVAIGIF